MMNQPYTKGLHKIGQHTYAYLQPDGSWGWSNAGLVSDGRSALLVDTLYDLALTREMLNTMAREVEAAKKIDTLVLTHANGDHVYGNELVKGAEIISSKACAKEMVEATPEMMAAMLKNAPDMGELGAFFLRSFSAFHFEGITLTLPTVTFEDRLHLKSGVLDIELMEVGPCHTKGDVIVFVPEDRVVYAGDMLFIGGTPIMWCGPVENWIRACDMMLEHEADAFVPGHGPITDKKGVQSIKHYWLFLEAEARKRFDAGMPLEKAILDIDPGPYAAWGEKERIAVNVAALYREFRHDDNPLNRIELFKLMAKTK